MRPTQSEKDLQAMLATRCKLEGAEVLQYAVPGGHRALAGAVPVGHPDMLTIWPAKWPEIFTGPDDCRCVAHIWIEVKRPGGKATPNQLAMHERLRRAGDAVYVVESEAQMLAALRREGIWLRSEGG